MDGGATFMIAMSALSAAGTAVGVADTINSNEARERQLLAERKQKELEALDAENVRLQGLNLANQDMLANANGIDAWSSPSLIASRNFNFRMAEQDIENTRYNLDIAKASIDSRIGVLKSNSRATFTAGIFEIVGTIGGAIEKSGLLSKSTEFPGAGKAAKSSGANSKPSKKYVTKVPT